MNNNFGSPALHLQKLLLVLLLGSQVDFFVGTFLAPTLEEQAKGYVGYNATVFMDNMWSDYRPDRDGNRQSFFTVFAVFFPAVTGDAVCYPQSWALSEFFYFLIIKNDFFSSFSS